jgi:hypothetical protein
MNQGNRTMKHRFWTAGWLVAALCFAAAGCDDGGSGDDGGSPPSVDVNGFWNAWEDGVPLGAMTLDVGATGVLTGTLTTVQGAEAQLAGEMRGYDAVFSLTFPAEYYEAGVTFAEEGTTATGTLIGARGFRRMLRLTR